VRSLVEDPAPAVLTSYRKDDSAHGAGVASLEDPAFEVVIAKGDVKLRHLPRSAT
jgi:hypothetical protein